LIGVDFVIGCRWTKYLALIKGAEKIVSLGGVEAVFQVHRHI
jgi:hypothetical protein